MDGRLALREEANHLGRHLLGSAPPGHANFANHLLELYAQAEGKDFLLIHNPGGWGNSHLGLTQEWEKSIVEGIKADLEVRGYRTAFVQYQRTQEGWWEKAIDVKEQWFFFVSKSKMLAAELRFISQHLESLKIVMVGVSQGAAFSNAVLQRTRDMSQIRSIEVGIPFFYQSRRRMSYRSLILDSNGLKPDAMTERRLVAIVRAFVAAWFRWTYYRLRGAPKKFSDCIHVSGHDYHWRYPGVHGQIEYFLDTTFDTENKWRLT